MYVFDGGQVSGGADLFLGNTPGGRMLDRLHEAVIHDRAREAENAFSAMLESETRIASQVAVQLNQQLGISDRLDDMADLLEETLRGIDGRIVRAENRVTQVIDFLNDLTEDLPSDSVSDVNPPTVRVWRKIPI